MMNLRQKHILVVGLAKTGAAVARFLIRQGARVTVTDRVHEAQLGPLVSTMHQMGIRMELGRHIPASFLNTDLIVLSPGVPHTMAEVQAAIAAGVPVIGEIELASRFIDQPIIAVTGTNGKTTTTTLIGHMLATCGLNVFVGGNIGNPLIEYTEARPTADRVVVEISSFQLDTIQTFRPHIGVLLNITEDHLDRYPDFKGYVNAKGRLFENQRSTDIAILNGEDRPTREQLLPLPGTCHCFNGRLDADNETLIENHCITFKMPPYAGLTLDLSRCGLTGRHNFENIAAAALTVLAAGGNPDGIQRALDRFDGLPARLEHIATIDDVAYYNDSKATNVDAVVRALGCFEKGVILIMGGRDKGGSYETLKDPLKRHARKLIVMGEATPLIAAALKNDIDIETVGNMSAAVAAARKSAESGDTVLLSPACSSFDMYKGYRERGEDFRHQVLKAEK